MTGTPLSKSDHRCFICDTPLTKTFDPEHWTSFTFKDRMIYNYFYKNGEGEIIDIEQELNVDCIKTPILLPNDNNFTSCERLLIETRLWGIQFVVDPLHLIENHSKDLMEYIIDNLSKTERTILEELFSNHLDLSINPSYNVANWRMIWASYTCTWDNIYKNNSLIKSLIWSWSLIVKQMYTSFVKWDKRLWFYYFSFCLFHFQIWKKIETNPKLGIHLLWPHSVEQFWGIYPSLANQEKLEHSWVSLKKLWSSFSSSRNRETLALMRWLHIIRKEPYHENPIKGNTYQLKYENFQKL